MHAERTRVIVEVALAVALSAVLNTLKLWRMPNAGTVSLVMLPLVVVALRRGLLIGILAGALYGVIDFFIDPFPPLVWLQPLLDYPVAYAMVGLAGAFSGVWQRAMQAEDRARAAMAVVFACLVAGAARYLVHVLSGALFFAEYAPPGQPVLVYSALYNLYAPISMTLTALAALAILPALERAVPTAGPVTRP